MPSVLEEWTGFDVYFSQNTFYRPSRTVDSIRQLRALYVDIDFYNIDTKHLPPEFRNKGYTEQQILMLLETDYFNRKIPEPNIIIHSGRGLVLVWNIEPVPHQALPRWQAVENYLIKQCEELGADSKASDASRIFRLAGTRNSKSKRRVKVQYRYNSLYDLEDIQNEYLPKIEKPKQKKGKKNSTMKSAKTNDIYSNDIQNENKNANIIQYFNVFTLHYTRLQDLNKLLSLRNYNVEGYRELFCFLYRYWNCCFLKDKDEALRQTLEFNKQFTSPLREREVEKATASASKAYDRWMDGQENKQARENGYIKAGYNFTNAKLIDMLQITADEQKELQTIISKDEKQRRNTIAKRAVRREQGVQERAEYLSQQQQETAEKVQALRELMIKYPMAKRKELAEMLSVSVYRIDQLKKML